MASREYCSNMVEELTGWSQKLHDLSEKIGRVPSIKKYQLQPQIEELHIILTELDDRLCEMISECEGVTPLTSSELLGREGQCWIC